ncbi:unnamed protein product [Polarella glacialis]|uniref:Peptidyl-prolyl cis-trans isomerase n=1 Tax=Polarella glacialis TaxID=89957 RepID=A0A813F6R8_POLGL|nr:unnamed protein product [Polarella glacialis]
MAAAPVFQQALPGPTTANPTAVFETSEGDFEAEIYLDRVPITASNFIALCRAGFYDGLHFHRIIDGFMNQFGCPLSKDPDCPTAGQGSAPEVSFTNLRNGSLICRGPRGTIRDEHSARDSNVPGSLSMANVGQPNTGSSQIFFNVAHNQSLDWFGPGPSMHPVFGLVRKGLDVVTKISKVRTVKDKPVQPVKMIKVSILGAPEAVKSKGKPTPSSSSSSSSPVKKRKKSKKKARTLVVSSSSSSSSSSSRPKKRDQKRRR